MWLMTRFVALLAAFALANAQNVSHVVRSDWEQDEFAQILEDGVESGPDSLLRNVKLYQNNLDITSPYQMVPGSFEGDNSHYENYQTPYTPAYSRYLESGPFLYHNSKCHYGQSPQMSPSDVDTAFRYANDQLSSRLPGYKNNTYYKTIGRKELEGQYMELVSDYFARYKCFNKNQLANELPGIPIMKHYENSNRVGDVSCTPLYDAKVECGQLAKSKYRSIDGTCNNPYHPYWGRSNVCHIRLLPPDYSDGISAYRLTRDGRDLPSPRSISNYATPTKDYKTYYTSLVVAMGQLIHHDITSTTNYAQTPDGQPKIDCCTKPDYRCAAIQLFDQNDYLAARHKYRCLNFMRSIPCPMCKLGPRQQMNSQTSYLDGSVFYGTNDEEAQNLRTHKNGMLKTSRDVHGEPILPTSDRAKPCFSRNNQPCYLAGDKRVTQNPLLTVMHNVWLRNHNHHASKLQQVNPHWSDEKVYQEARRLLISEYNNIIYGEYLPIILGSLLSSYYNLAPLKQGYTTYEPNTDATSWSELTVVGRYGHSQVKDLYQIIFRAASNISMSLPLRDAFFEPNLVRDGLTDDIIRGLTRDPSNTIDPYYSLTVKNYIQREKNNPLNQGIDLVSTNTMRDRDYGHAGYTHFLKACFNFDAKSWKDLEKFIPAESLIRLQSLYSHIDEIDLYVGTVSERHFIDASVGPTTGCIVGIQFYHSKFGDRYYYEHGGQPGSFTPAQLQNIRASGTMARVLCRNVYSLGKMQPKPFYLPSGYNQLVDCSKFPDINYNWWKE